MPGVPGDVLRKMDKEGCLSERSEFSIPPIFCGASLGTPKGSNRALQMPVTSQVQINRCRLDAHRTKNSSLPMRTQDDAAQIHTLERRIFVGQEIIGEGTECAAGTMLHTVIKRVDHLM